MYENTSTASTITYTTGLLLKSGDGERPKPTPTELLVTRAVEVKDGWLGQILMLGEIVLESEAQETSSAALTVVNNIVHERFKQLILGS